MEGAGKLIDDEELREAMQEKGLGTPATRAAIIEGLIYEKYIHRDGRDLVPGAKASQLMTLLRGLGVEDLTRPELTGEWEYRLSEIEKGRLSRDAFMASIAEMAERIVAKAKTYGRDTIPGDYATLASPCPGCGGVVRENYRRYACVGKPPQGGRGFSISKIPGSGRRAGRGDLLPTAASDRSRLPLQPRAGPTSSLRGRGPRAACPARVRLRRGAKRRGRVRRAGRLLGEESRAAPQDAGRVSSTEPTKSPSTRRPTPSWTSERKGSCSSR